MGYHGFNRRYQKTLPSKSTFQDLCNGIKSSRRVNSSGGWGSGRPRVRR